MKRKTFSRFLFIEAIFMATGSLVVQFFPSIFRGGNSFLGAIGNFFSSENGDIMYLFSFPFEGISKILSVISSSGRISSAVATLLLFLMSFLFFVPLLKNYNKKGELTENIILALTGLLFGFTEWCFVTERFYLFTSVGKELTLPVVKCIFGGSVWSGVICFLFIKVLRLFKNSEKEKLLHYTKYVSFALSAVFVFLLFNLKFSSLLGLLQSAIGSADILNALADFVVASASYILDIFLMFYFYNLADAVLCGKQAPEINRIATSLSSYCLRAAISIIALSFLKNALQILLYSKLSNVNVVVTMPFVTVGFSLLILIFSIIVRENKELKDESELIV